MRSLWPWLGAAASGTRVQELCEHGEFVEPPALELLLPGRQSPGCGTETGIQSGHPGWEPVGTYSSCLRQNNQKTSEREKSWG